jgi:VanZ family protein
VFSRLVLTVSALGYDQAMLRKAAYIWLVGWAIFGLPWTGVTSRPSWHRRALSPLRRSRRRRMDAALNFTYYVPLGIIGMGLGWGAGPTALAAAILSGTTELIQIFARYRYPSLVDVMMNVGGAVAGIGVALAVRHIRRHRLSAK